MFSLNNLCCDNKGYFFIYVKSVNKFGLNGFILYFCGVKIAQRLN